MAISEIKGQEWRVIPTQ